MIRHSIFASLALFALPAVSSAGAPDFPPFGSATGVKGTLVAADFIHRAGQFRAADGRLTRFIQPPSSLFTYRGAEADLRDVPLGTQFEFLMLPDADGRLTRLVGTKHDGPADESQRLKFVEFTKARGLAGRIDTTGGKTVTVTFFSSAPGDFTTNWGEDFSVGKEVRVCVANDELRTWNAATVGERGTVVAAETVPVAGHGHSGRRVTIRVGHQLEGFRPGRIVRVFGSGWTVQNQNFMECLINYGYSHRPAPDFSENWARHYPEQFPFRTDHGNRHLPWFQVKEGVPPPMYAEHVVSGELTEIDPASQSGRFKTEDTGKEVPFTMLDTGSKKPAVRYLASNAESTNATLADLPPGQRYRFHLFQDAEGAHTRCSFITDDFSQMAINGLNYQVQSIDAAKGRIEVTWQRLPVQNYQKEMETPPPYGRSLLPIGPETRYWKDKTPVSLADLQAGDLIKANQTAELPGQPARCVDIWLNPEDKKRK